jgi:hypothetical protein
MRKGQPTAKGGTIQRAWPRRSLRSRADRLPSDTGPATRIAPSAVYTGMGGIPTLRRDG